MDLCLEVFLIMPTFNWGLRVQAPRENPWGFINPLGFPGLPHPFEPAPLLATFARPENEIFECNE